MGSLSRAKRTALRNSLLHPCFVRLRNGSGGRGAGRLLQRGWDYMPVMNEPVEELRRRYTILPFETFSTTHQQAVGNDA